MAKAKIGAVPKNAAGESSRTTLNYFYQNMIELSPKAALAGFISLWLRKAVVPGGSSCVSRITRDLLLPAVKLVFGHRLALLPAMVCDIYRGLREPSNEILRPGGSKSEFPRVELSYHFLMAWLALHRPGLLHFGTIDGHEGGDATIRNFRRAKWAYTDVPACRWALSRLDGFIFNQTPSPCPDYQAGDQFMDQGEKKSEIPRGAFRWLQTIRPSHLVYRNQNRVFLEPYLPSRFARQFGYSQTLMCNPSRCLGYEGSLLDGARAWSYYNIGRTGATFTVPIVRGEPRILYSATRFYCLICPFFAEYNRNKSFLEGTHFEPNAATLRRAQDLDSSGFGASDWDDRDRRTP